MFDALLASFRLNRWLWDARRSRPVPHAGVVVGSPAKVVGLVRDVEPLVSPFTLTPCVAWMARVEEKGALGGRGMMLHDGQPAFIGVIFESRFAPFWIDVDGGGRLHVDDAPGTLSLALQNVNEHPHVNDENPSFGTFMRSGGIPTTMHMGIAGDHRFWEATLRTGERVSVYGTAASTEVVVAGAYRGVAASQLSLRGEEAKPLVITRA